MTPSAAIQYDQLCATSKLVVNQPGFSNRISWWLQRAHSTERWIQFEWAFQLQQQLKSHISVICEHTPDRLDISLVEECDNNETLWYLPSSAGLEIKWYGNWWVDNFESVKLDVSKIQKLKFPAVAVLLYLHVEVKDSEQRLRWIPKQAASQGCTTWDDALRRLTNTVGEPHPETPEHQLILDDSSPLLSASLRTIAYYNERANFS